MSLRHLQDMSSRRLQDMSSRRLQDVFSVTIFRLPRRLQNVFARRLQDVLEDVKLLGWRRVEDVFKTYLEDVFKTNKLLLGLHCKYLHFVRWSLISHSLIGNMILEQNFEIFDRLNFCKSISICNTLKTYVHKFSVYNLWYTLEEKKIGFLLWEKKISRLESFTLVKYPYFFCSWKFMPLFSSIFIRELKNLIKNHNFP